MLITWGNLARSGCCQILTGIPVWHSFTLGIAVPLWNEGFMTCCRGNLENYFMACFRGENWGEGESDFPTSAVSSNTEMPHLGKWYSDFHYFSTCRFLLILQTHSIYWKPSTTNKIFFHLIVVFLWKSDTTEYRGNVLHLYAKVRHTDKVYKVCLIV